MKIPLYIYAATILHLVTVPVVEAVILVVVYINLFSNSYRFKRLSGHAIVQ